MTEQMPEPMAESADSAPGAAPMGVADFTALRAGLPAELRDNPALRNYASFEGMARSLVEAQRMVGKRVADASPEELGRFYDRHGRPEKPDGYSFGEPAASGTSPSELETAARQWFHQAGLSQHQAATLHEQWSAFMGERQTDVQTRSAESQHAAERELRGEWGGAYGQRLRAAARAARDFGGEPLLALLEETRLGDDPRVIRAFARIAQRIGEDGLAGGEGGEGRSDFGLSSEGARREIARLMTQPAYFDADHLDHDRSVARMKSLFAAAYPAGSNDGRRAGDAPDEA
jgi:hypothetical protein